MDRVANNDDGATPLDPNAALLPGGSGGNTQMNGAGRADEPHAVLHDVSLVVPTVGRPLLKDCLRSISASEVWPAELLVVDQSGSAEIAAQVEELRRRGMNAAHLPMNGAGIAAAMNHGVRHVRTTFVAVTHDDCRVEGRWLGSLLDRAVGGGPVVVTGRVMAEEGREVPSVMTSADPAVYTQPLRDRDVLFPANMLFPLAVWLAVGPMDEDPLFLRASEDNEWAYRVLRVGIPIVYEPDAVVVHVAWRDAAALRDVMWTYAHAQGAFYGKYMRRADPHVTKRATIEVLRGLWWWLRGEVSRDRTLAERGYVGTVGLIRGIIAGFTRGGPMVIPPAHGEGFVLDHPSDASRSHRAR
jgi:GT2 family glycosyltransferase